MIQALLSAEDADYFEHEGLDYKGMVRATIENISRRGYSQGASTITQQVVKQMLLTPEKTLRRKIQEIILARRLSQQFSKAEILTLYLNQVYFGHGRYGVEEASRYFFGKSISDVDVGEAALLAGLVQSPERLSPYKHPDAAKARQVYVLAQMAKLDFITEDTARTLAAAPIVVIHEGSSTPRIAPEATDSVRKRLESQFGADKVAHLGLQVMTTIDSRLEVLARQALEHGLQEYDQRHGLRGPLARLSGANLDRKLAKLRAERTKPLGPNERAEAVVEKVEVDADAPEHASLLVSLGDSVGVVDLSAEPRYTLGKPPLVERFRPGDVVRVRLTSEHKRGNEGRLTLALAQGPQAAMVVLDPVNKDVLALVGGYGYRLGNFDRSQRAQRPPGSAFKPFVYAAAIDSKRYTAASVVNDSPEIFGTTRVNNEDGDFRGPLRLRQAMALSINSVPVKLIADMGPESFCDIARQVGITSPLTRTPLLALGTAPVSPFEMANAYATIAAGGQSGEPRLVSAIGSTQIAQPGTQKGIRPETAYVILSMLRTVVAGDKSRLSTLVSADKVRHASAGTASTLNSEKDAWFVGFTPELLAAVWVGFDDGQPLGEGEDGHRTALPIWNEFMKRALVNYPPLSFTKPDGVVEVDIDPSTGLLPTPGGRTISEFFLDGTAPTESAAEPGEEDGPDAVLLGE